MERDFSTDRPVLRPGAHVEVLTRFRGNWACGFEVAAAGDRGCLIRRTSDGVVLPVEFAYALVRPLEP